MDTLGEDRTSRRAVAVAGLIAVVLILVSCGTDGRSRHEVASAADRADRAESGCARRLTVLFWPKGHPAIPSIDFPSLPMPHVEIYGGADPSYPMRAALAWAFTHPPGPGFSAALDQARVHQRPLDGRSAGPRRRQCVGRRGQARPPPAKRGADRHRRIRPGRYTFAVIDPASDVVLDGVVAEEASELRYSETSCGRRPPPG